MYTSHEHDNATASNLEWDIGYLALIEVRGKGKITHAHHTDAQAPHTLTKRGERRGEGGRIFSLPLPVFILLMITPTREK